MTGLSRISGARPIGVAVSPATIVAAWLATLAVDFALHAGLLAPAYDWASPFLTTRADAFARIPLGYGGLLLQVAVVAWLLDRLGADGPVAGATLAAGLGAGLEGAFLLGLGSISTAEPTLLAAWFGAAVAEFAVAGWVIGARIAGRPMRWVALRVAVVVVVAVSLGIALQSLRLAGTSTLPG